MATSNLEVGVGVILKYLTGESSKKSGKPYTIAEVFMPGSLSVVTVYVDRHIAFKAIKGDVVRLAARGDAFSEEKGFDIVENKGPAYRLTWEKA